MARMRLPPVGFWSYARQDDTLSSGQLSRLRSLVRSELQQQFGREQIQIFQDVSAIPHGARWEAEIRHSLDNATFFIPIVTPLFLQSKWCCREVQLFLDRQQRLYDAYPDLPRTSRIFPVHFIDIDGAETVDPAMLLALRELQWLDFLDLRHRDYAESDIRQTLSIFARSIRDLLRVQVDEPPTAEELAQARAEEAARIAEVEAASAVRLAEAARREEEMEVERLHAESERAAGIAAALKVRTEAQARRRASLGRLGSYFRDKRVIIAVIAILALLPVYLVAAPLVKRAWYGSPPETPTEDEPASLDATSNATEVEASAIVAAMRQQAFERNKLIDSDPAGVALRGYDAVAYSTRSQAVEGRPDQFVLWNGAIWLFESAANAERFEADPGLYAPQHGGFCTVCLAQGHVSSASPKDFTVWYGKTYLFSTARLRDVWIKDPVQNIVHADRNAALINKEHEAISATKLGGMILEALAALPAKPGVRPIKAKGPIGSQSKTSPAKDPANTSGRERPREPAKKAAPTSCKALVVTLGRQTQTKQGCVLPNGQWAVS